MNAAVPRLGAELTSKVLAFLGVPGGLKPDLALLDDLVTAYTRHTPWESASRIAKIVDVLESGKPVGGQVIARWPAEFWRNALDWGTGGTCFESNYAFFALLAELGFAGYLTVNNMDPTVGCHAAIVLNIDGDPWLADVGLPLYTPLALDPDQETERQSVFHDYTVRPSGRGAYRIERDHHPQPYCFTLVDEAIPDTTYRQVVAGDYGPNGLFLDRVIISKVIGGHICRFNGGEQPYKLERFRRGYKDSRELGDDPAGEVAEFFNLNRQLLRRALVVSGAIHP
jgi:arylamine N-acetyltransferase